MFKYCSSELQLYGVKRCCQTYYIHWLDINFNLIWCKVNFCFFLFQMKDFVLVLSQSLKPHAILEKICSCCFLPLWYLLRHPESSDFCFHADLYGSHILQFQEYYSSKTNNVYLRRTGIYLDHSPLILAYLIIILWYSILSIAVT